MAKVKKTYNILLRILILLATYGFLYKKIFHGKDWQQQYNLFMTLLDRPGIKMMLAFVILLMFLNWGIEAWKWRFMIRKIEKISFFRSLQAIFAGASISFFTPNRTGEYFGRAFILDKASHVEGILITILGSMSQLLVTILMGSASLLVFVPYFLGDATFFSGYAYFGFAVLIVILNALLLFLFLNVQFLSVLREKLLRSRLKRFRKFFAVFSGFRNRDMLYVICLCFLRYIVFTVQFLLLLKMFSVPVPLPEAVMIISLIFLVLSVVPTVTLTELGVRDTAAVYFFGIYFHHAGTMTDSIMIGILSAASVLWVVNLAIPAIIGTVFVSRLKFFRKNSPAE